jgi:hypothetical protein
MLGLPAARRSPSSPDPRRTATLRAAARKLLALGGALLVLVSTLTAGRSYLWCAMMQQTVDRCCCEPEPTANASEAGPDSAPGAEAGCCEHQGIESTAPGSVASAPIELPAVAPVDTRGTPAVVTAASAPVAARPVVAQLVRARPIRAGPATGSDICIRLQVIRC